MKEQGIKDSTPTHTDTNGRSLVQHASAYYGSSLGSDVKLAVVQCSG